MRGLSRRQKKVVAEAVLFRNQLALSLGQLAICGYASSGDLFQSFSMKRHRCEGRIQSVRANSRS